MLLRSVQKGEHRPGRARRSFAGKTSLRIVVPLALILLTIAFYWKLGLTNQYTWLESDDLAYQVLPWIKYQAAEWGRGRVPLWDPNHSGGQSLIGQGQPGTAYPLNWVLFSMPLVSGDTVRLGFLNWYFIAVHAMAVLFCYWLCRDLKRTRVASALAGTAFGLGSFLNTVNWPQMTNGTVWIPLVILFLLRAVRGRRPWSSAALSGTFAGVAWLSGHHQIPIFTGVTAAALWLFYAFRKRRAAWKIARLAAVALVFAALVGALQILPAYEYGNLALRWVGAEHPVGWQDPVPYAVHTELSLVPSALLGLLVPIGHAQAFIGMIVGALALLAIAARWRNRSVRVFVAISAIGLSLALGGFNVFHGMLYAVAPMFEKARTPSFAIVLFQFGAAVLAAFGLDALPGRRARRWPPGATALMRKLAGGMAVIGALLYAGSFAILLANRMEFPLDGKVVLSAAIALAAAALIAAAARGSLSRTSLIACAGMLMLIELSAASDFVFTPLAKAERFQKFTSNQEVVDFLRRQPGPFRIDVDADSVPYNFGDWHELDQYNGYMASLPENVVRAGLLVPSQTQLYGVAYTITRKPEAPAGGQLVFQAGNGLKVYHHSNAFPRVWAVHRVSRMKSPEPAGDPKAEAFVPGQPPAVEACSGADDVRLIGRSSGRLNIVADLACKGMVVVSDNYFPGWKATVDGKPAEIHAAYLSLRGVVVPAGHHRIDMRYRPASVIAGAMLTALGLLLAAALSLWEARRPIAA
ncbi:MAG TPA: YfhO family protein [Bryobacteraceae bacterium]|nr:YfhO family protein [Bryobacteraceae bacterium]